MRIKDKKGITLVELMIYLVISTVVIGYALSTITATSQNYVRSRETVKLQTAGRNSMLLLARDFSNMGYKTILVDTGGGNTEIRQLPGTWTGADNVVTPLLDSAGSFLFQAGFPHDTIEIFKAEMIRDDSLDEIIRVQYVVDSATATLLRISQPLDTAGFVWGDRDTMTILQNVEAIQYRFTTDGINWHDNPTGIRDQVEEVRIELLARSLRTMRITTNKEFVVGGTQFSTADTSRSKYMWRLYQETVEVTNNGNLF